MKKFFKNNLKTILVAGTTAIICISGTAFAAYYQYNAKQVEYKDGKSVEYALNDLYEISQNSIFNNSFDTIVVKSATNQIEIPKGDYKYYYLFDLHYCSSKSDIALDTDRTEIKEILNGTYKYVGNTGNAATNSSAMAKVYIIKTSNENESITVTFNGLVDNVSVYGIK